jgi:hypothetical protein
VVAGQQVWHDPPPGVAGKSYVTQDTAYRARDLLEIRISDLRKVGAVIDTLLALGLTEMTGPKFLATTTAEAREVVGPRSELPEDPRRAWSNRPSKSR